MNYLVGYNSTAVADKALNLACVQARLNNAKLFLLTSMEGGSGEKMKAVEKAELALETAKKRVEAKGVECETDQMARGLSPGEDIVRYAKDNAIDHIFLGIEKKSKTAKLLMGSTAQYVILKSECPVTTTK